MADIEGTDGNDALNGTTGADTIDGGGGNDTIAAGAGNDVVYGDSNNLIAQPADTTDATVSNNFQVISLGTAADIDPIESGGTSGFSEDGGLLNGATYGSTGDPLSANVVDLTPGTGNGDGQYDGDQNVSSDTFFINGVEYTFDGSAVYNNTIVTFEDGTTAMVSAVVFQDTAGNLYLAPESTNNADTAIYTSQPITSIQLGTQDTSGGLGNGLTAARVTDSWVENSEVVLGPDGDDAIDGGDGDDTIFGEGGNDSIAGGSGNDTIYGDNTESQVIGDDFSNGDWSGSATFDSERATFLTDNQWTNAVTTTPSGMSSGNGAGGGAQISLDFAWSDGIPPESSGSADFYIDYGGVNYVQITTPADGSAAIITYHNGATGPAGPIPEGDAIAGTGYFTLTFDLPPGVPDSGQLEFWADTTGGEDNFSIDNVAVIRDGHMEPGDDTIDGGIGNDTIVAGEGSDTILLSDNFGDDTIFGGEDPDGLDIDTIDASSITTGGVTVTVTNESGSVVQGADSADFSEIESFTLTDQNDSFTAFGTSDVTVDGGAGDDTFQEGNGNNTLFGGAGNDTFEVGYGTSTIDGGTGTDTLSAAGADDAISVTFNGTGSGTYDDLTDSDSGSFSNIEAVQGSSGADSINAAADGGGVQLFGGAGDDTIIGGSGNDTIDGGAGADTLTGGTGADVFVAGGAADVITDFDTTTGIDGGASDNNDFVDLTSYYNQANLDAWNLANPGQTYATPLGWLRADQADNGVLDIAGGMLVQNSGAAVAANELNAENTGVVCFASGTLIETPSGLTPIEQLTVGDLVISRDNGPQPIVWAGRKELTSDTLARLPQLKPIWLSARFFGLVENLVVSPQHGVLLRSPERGGTEQLFRATHLADLQGGGARRMRGCRHVTYHHLMFETHQIIRANGIWSESLYPGKMALSSMPEDSLQEIFAVFPELQRNEAPICYGRSARDYSRRGGLPESLSDLMKSA